MIFWCWPLLIILVIQICWCHSGWTLGQCGVYAGEVLWWADMVRAGVVYCGIYKWYLTIIWWGMRLCNSLCVVRCILPGWLQPQWRIICLRWLWPGLAGLWYHKSQGKSKGCDGAYNTIKSKTRHSACPCLVNCCSGLVCHIVGICVVHGCVPLVWYIAGLLFCGIYRQLLYGILQGTSSCVVYG